MLLICLQPHEVHHKDISDIPSTLYIDSAPHFGHLLLITFFIWVLFPKYLFEHFLFPHKKTAPYDAVHEMIITNS